MTLPRIGAYRNTHHVTVSDRHGFSIEQLNTEMPGAGQTADSKTKTRRALRDADQS
jgi:hypothetical protein